MTCVPVPSPSGPRSGCRAMKVLVCGSRTWQDTVVEARRRGIPVEVCALRGEDKRG